MKEVTEKKSRRKESAAYWQNHVKAWERSGKSLKASGARPISLAEARFRASDGEFER